MKKITLTALAILVITGCGFMLRAGGPQPPTSSQMATDGAFRDGLYLGKLDAQNSGAYHIPRGRWSAEKDRANFAAGYEQGYKTSAVITAKE